MTITNWNLLLAAIFCSLFTSVLCIVPDASLVRKFCSGNTFCVHGYPDEIGNTIFTVFYFKKGWASIGIGAKMAGSACYVGWQNGSTSVVVSSFASGHSQPSPQKIQDIKQVSLQIPRPSWAKTAFSFSRPNELKPTITSSTTYRRCKSETSELGLWERRIRRCYSKPNSMSFEAYFLNRKKSIPVYVDQLY